MINPKMIQAIFEHAHECYPNECCGLVTQKGKVQTYHRVDNVSHEPLTAFEMDANQYADIADNHTVIAVAHSHCGDGATTLPSASDIAHCNELEIPYAIASLPEGDFRIVEPESLPLIGRPWALGSYDCWGLIMAFHKMHGIELKDFRKPYEWWLQGENLYEENWKEAGFIAKREPEFGDMIIFQLSSEVWNHGGIYVGNNQILHHLQDRLSVNDIYSGWYQDKTKLICRHKDLKYGISENY